VAAFLVVRCALSQQAPSTDEHGRQESKGSDKKHNRVHTPERPHIVSNVLQASRVEKKQARAAQITECTEYSEGFCLQGCGCQVTLYDLLGK
jgi:hypothetical protein